MKIPEARFFLDKPKSKKETVIMLAYRIPSQNKRVLFSTKEYCKPKYWSNETRRVKNSIQFQDSSRINKILNNYADIAVQIFKDFEGNITTNEFKKELEYRTGRKERILSTTPMTLFRFIDEFIQKEKSKVNAERGTWKKYESVFNHLQNFANEKSITLDFDNIDWEFKRLFENWCYTPPRSHSANNVSKLFQVIRRFMRIAQRDGYHENEIYKESDFTVKRVKVKNKIRLTSFEVDAIIGTDFSDSPHLDKVRDMFVAACYSGLRVSDWKKINKQHLRTYGDSLFLNVMMEKTKKEVSIPIMQPLLDVLKKYDYQMPTMVEQVFNRSIKRVLKRAIPDSTFLRIYSKGGVTKDETVPKWEFASSHARRRTFASNRYLEGWSLRKIKNILGHASEKQTEEYMDISDWELSQRDTRMIQLVESARTLRKVK